MKLPQPPAKAMPFTAHTLLTKGSIVAAPKDNTGGWWVVMQDHVTGNFPTPGNLQPGQSNDFYHWSTGPS